MLDIKILGSGCTNIEKVTDFKEIASYGIMSTPGLVVNGKILSSGKLPTKNTLQHWLMS